jgi:ketosteroid isomerase-like protein
MSQENVEIVRRVIDAQNRDDLAESLRLYFPEAEIDWSRSKGPLRGVYRGHVGIKTFQNEFWTAFEDIRLDAHDFMASGSEVVVPNTAHLRGRDGIEVVARATFVYTVENRRITRVRMFQERAEALKAVGIEK